MRGNKLALAGVIVATLAIAVITLGAHPPDTCGAVGGDPCSGAVGQPSDSPVVTAPPMPSSASLPPIASLLPTERPDPTPTPRPPVMTFDDEFGGTVLKPIWGQHWPRFGKAWWARSQVSVANGLLTIKATRVGSTWVSSLIDTVGTFKQKYGVFSARIRIPEGGGLWPAFWAAQPPSASGDQAEIDIMEVCADPPGGNGGNDVTLLHNFVHDARGNVTFGQRYRTTDLAGAWHVYTMEWRPDYTAFFLDGLEVSRFASSTGTSAVPMVVVLDLAVAGGGWCGVPDATTPRTATMQVDWVRVTR